MKEAAAKMLAAKQTTNNKQQTMKNMIKKQTNGLGLALAAGLLKTRMNLLDFTKTKVSLTSSYLSWY